MSLPPLADAFDLGDWVQESIEENDSHARAVLKAASVLVRSYCGQDFTNKTVPDAVEQVTVQVAGRLWRSAGGATYEQDQMGPFSQSRRFGGDGGPYLTKGEKSLLSPYRRPGASLGLGTLTTTRGEPRFDDQYLPVEDGSDMPFLPDGGRL